ncbi:hypothetical protein D9599_00795 [Roseomonas sp. KE2513]|uniref:hypothetical protein n=1 Tax=Roseomonas sp. KE2513 TaxID=2479202 RepID=UPI0018DFB599|nr:hypothetical protein [Roseomonas sp. KE2513]MBI0534112.1 hypothetical protein [Roseomonas sp. KE2513]
MKIRHNANERAYVFRYEVGDLVRLRVDEAGEGAVGRAGQWGRVTAVAAEPSGALDIQLAGYSEAKTSMLPRLVGVPRSIVLPCEANGALAELPDQPRARQETRSLNPRTTQRVVVNTAVAPASALPAWAASLVVAGCTLILVVAAGIAAKNFGLL